MSLVTDCSNGSENSFSDPSWCYDINLYEEYISIPGER